MLFRRHSTGSTSRIGYSIIVTAGKAEDVAEIRVRERAKAGAQIKKYRSVARARPARGSLSAPVCYHVGPPPENGTLHCARESLTARYFGRVVFPIDCGLSLSLSRESSVDGDGVGWWWWRPRDNCDGWGKKEASGCSVLWLRWPVHPFRYPDQLSSWPGPHRMSHSRIEAPYERRNRHLLARHLDDICSVCCHDPIVTVLWAVRAGCCRISSARECDVAPLAGRRSRQLTWFCHCR
ncbi:hypothetical protein BZA05DRAFT_227074 [Tricharina praecox]|uniref:uncharacterized protein n=1 Tax=Tricharina praecox TaxID=43433 RepID=UPI00221F7863|nr:uncharacterized protein BZA05DRAFT_227074 [Tricharina praecox]KAI5856132.1 hypothetical protein BZA05DRAFT_227074 [Tricharina praecox]